MIVTKRMLRRFLLRLLLLSVGVMAGIGLQVSGGLLVVWILWCLLYLLFALLLFVFGAPAEVIQKQKRMDDQLDPQGFLDETGEVLAKATDPGKPAHQIALDAKRRALYLLGDTEGAVAILRDILAAPGTKEPLARATSTALLAMIRFETDEKEAAEQLMSEMETLVSCLRLKPEQADLFEAARAVRAAASGDPAMLEQRARTKLNDPKLSRLAQVSYHADLGEVLDKTGRTEEAIEHYRFVYVYGNALPLFQKHVERLQELSNIGI